MAKNKKQNRKYKNKSAELTKALGIVRSANNISEGLGDVRSELHALSLLKLGSVFEKKVAYRSFIALNKFPKEVSEINQVHKSFGGSLIQTICWISSYLLNYSEELSDFVKLKQEIDLAFLHSEYDHIETKLDYCQESFGYSIWLLENRLKLLQLSIGKVSVTPFLAKTLEEKPGPLTTYILKSFYMRLNSTTSPKTFEDQIDKQTEDTPVLRLLLSMFNNRFYEVSEKNLLQVLYFSEEFSLIDRYETLLKTLSYVVSCNTPTSDDTILLKATSSLEELISDPRLSRISVAIGNGTQLHPTASNFKNTLSLYEANEMHRVVDSIFPLTNISTIDHLNLLARASIIGDIKLKLEQINTVLSGDILKDLLLLNSFSLEGLEARQRLEKIISIHSSANWSNALSSILERQINDERLFKPTSKQSYCSFQVFQDHPLIAFSLPKREMTIRYLGRLDHTSHMSSLLISEDENLRVSEGVKTEHSMKINRYIALNSCKSGNYSNTINYIEKYQATSPNDLIYKELQAILVKCLLESNNLRAATNAAAELFVENPYYSTVLPLQKLIDELLQQHNLSLATSKTRGLISTAIAFDIYSRNISSDYDAQKADAFNDVLKRYDINHASDLTTKIAICTDIQLIYFLKNVCKSNVLDQSLSLRSSLEVEEERIRVLLKAEELQGNNSNKKTSNSDEDEIRAIRTNQVIRNTNEQLNSSKIYVNIEGIRREAEVFLRESWARFASYDIDPFDEQINLIRKLLKDELKLSIQNANPSSAERKEIFRFMLAHLRHEFTSNNEYGLNSNLSTNIRHGYVLRELRSPFVATRIITNRDIENGTYQDNKHWIEKFNNLPEEKLSTFISTLNNFSTKVDEIIQNLNDNLLQIRSNENKNGLFDYSIFDKIMPDLYLKIGAFSTFDSLIEEVFDTLWEITQGNLNYIRAVLENKIYEDLKGAADDLEKELRLNELNIDLSEIEAAIIRSRNILKPAIDRVMSWFTLSEGTDYQDYDIKIAYQAGLKTVESYYADTNIVAILNIVSTKQLNTESSKQLKGWTLPFLVRLFFLLFENAGKHGSEQGEDLHINVDVNIEVDQLHIKVSNSLKNDYDKDRLENIIEKINKDFGIEGTMNLVGEEGGSGYPKIWKIVTKDLKSVHVFSVELIDDFFTTELLIGNDKLR